MARATGCVVITGDKDGEYRMTVEFLGQLTMMPHPLRTEGYYAGFRTSAEMIEHLMRRASSIGGAVVERAEVTGSAGNLGAGFSGDEMRTVESQSSTESPKTVTPRALSPSVTGKEGFSKEDLGKDSSGKEKEVLVEENTRKEVLERDVSGRSDAVVGLGPYLGPFTDKPAKARAMGRAPIGSLRRDQSNDEVETEIVDVHDYFVFGDDRNVPVSLHLLPLELEERESIGVSDSSTEFSLLGKSNGMDVMRPISAWKLEFLQDLSSHFLVKITLKNGAKWVKLDKPRSDFKETAADVYFVANVISLLKKEPQASEDILWNLLQGEIASETFRDKLRMLYPVIEQFIIVDPVLKEAGAQKTLQSLLDRAKVGNSGKRVLSDKDVSDEVENRPVKKLKSANVAQKSDKPPKAGVPSIEMPGEESDDEIMGEFESDEENSEDDESGEDFGDSFCSFCDDGGDLLCCDGPCMRSFHASEEDGIQTNCKSLGLSKAAVARMVGRWLCRNCKYGRHQCYICGKLGASSSDEALGGRQEVFVCNVACCGKFYHPKCIASKLTVSLSERDTFAKNIQAGKESFTCPLHTCKACGNGEDREEEGLSLVKCRRCPKAWHKKCLPRTMPFEEDAKEMGVQQRAWSFGNKQQQNICYCTDHEVIEYLGTPRRDHVDFGRPPQVAQQRNKVREVTKEPARNEADTSSAAAIVKSSGKKYSSPELHATAKPDRLPGSSSVPSSRPSSSVPSQRSIISKDAAKRFEEVAIRTVDSIVKAVRQRVTEDSMKVKQEKNLPGIYKPRKMRTEFMKMGVLHSILEAAKNAVARIRQDKFGDAKIICDRKNVVDALHEEDRLRTYLSPTLFGKRYTSYGRHFTKVQKLEKVVEILQPFILERDTIVDFSCGDNTFCKLLREALPVAGKTNCQFKNFDIFPSKDSFGFEQKDWLDVGMRECGPGDNLVIGLNPPFAFVDKFVSHALDMNPRILVLIVPPMKKNLEHLGYLCLVDDGSLMTEKSFYLPGSVNEKSTECLEQGNNVAPHFFIYGSKKFYGHRKSGVPEEGPSTANPMPTSRVEKPVKPPPPSEPTANIFIPPAQQRGPQPVPNPGKRKVTPHERDPRLQVPNRVPRPAARASLDDGEFLSPRQRHPPFNSPSHAPFHNPRPVWRFDDLPPPPPLPPALPEPWSVPHHYHQEPRQHEQHGFYPPDVGPRHHPPAEYSAFQPDVFHHGGMPPFRHQPHTGFGPMRPLGNARFHYQRPPPSRIPDFPPADDDESFGGWISH